MSALIRGIAAALFALVLALVPVFGEETFAGEGGVINLPAAAVQGPNGSLASLGWSTRPPLLQHTQGTSQMLTLGLPPIMTTPAAVCAVCVWSSTGGVVPITLPSTTFSLGPSAMQALMSRGVTQLRLLFVSSNQLLLYATLDFNATLKNVTVRVP